MYLTTPQFWWLVALVLAVAEYFLPGIVLIFPAIAAAVVAVLASLGFSVISLQVIVFIALSAGLLFFMRPIWMRFAMGKTKKTGVDAFIGKEARVVETVDKNKGTGRVKIGADTFPAKSDHHITEGHFVIIKNIEGITLIVEEKNEQ